MNSYAIKWDFETRLQLNNFTQFMTKKSHKIVLKFEQNANKLKLIALLEF